MPRDFIHLSQRQKRRIVSKNSDSVAPSRKVIRVSESSFSSSVPSILPLVYRPSSSNNNSTSQIPQLIISDSTPSLDLYKPQCGVQSTDASNLSSDWPIQDLGSSSDSKSASEPHPSDNFYNIHSIQAIEGQTFIENTTFSDDLRQCFLNHSVSHSFINDLFHIFHKHSYHTDLPKDSRTFMETPRSNTLNIMEMGEGKYIHFGLENNFKKALAKHCIGKLFSNELGTKLSWFGLRGNENISK